MEGPNKHWGIEKKKLTSGGGGDVYLALKSKHFIHFSTGGYTSVYLQRYRNPLTFLGSVRFFDWESAYHISCYGFYEKSDGSKYSSR